MPGVIVETTPRGGAGAALQAPSGTWFVVGVAERGIVGTAIECRGMADFLRKLGDPVSYGTLYDQAVAFFREGGARMYVARLVGPSATKGTATVKDRSDAPGINTLTLNAASEGAWTSRLTYWIRDGGDPNTFRITVYIDGNAVQDETNLTSPDAAVAAFADSEYLRLINAGSSSIAPANNPATTVAPVALTTDGTDDRASITDALRLIGLTAFTKDLGDGAVSIPGSTSGTIYDGIRDHCIATNRIGILGADQGATKSELESSAAGRGGDLGSEYLGLFAPWVLVPDGAGGSKAIGPEGFVAACRNRAHAAEGPYRVPAGDDYGVAKYVLGVDGPFTDDDADDLDAARVNIIREFGNVPELYGWRSLASDEINYYWLKNRDLLNYLTVQAKAVLKRELFKNIDGRGHLLANVKNDLIALCEPIAAAGGLFAMTGPDGTSITDPGYAIDVGSDINPLSSLQTQTVNAAMYLRPAPAASLIKLVITEVALNAAV
jgi:hypothetical protein